MGQAGDTNESGARMNDTFNQRETTRTTRVTPSQLHGTAIASSAGTPSAVTLRPEIEVVHGVTYLPILNRFVRTSRIWLAVSLLVLNVCDVITTRMVLTNGGVEVNPVMAGLMQGTAAPLLLKTAVSLVAGALLLAAPRASRRSEVAVACVVGLYLAIVLWNLMVFIRL